MDNTHPLNILNRINKEVFQFLHLNGYTFDYKIENYYGDMTLKYSIDFTQGTERGQVILDIEGLQTLKNKMNIAFFNEPERFTHPITMKVVF
ncbi:hypothetical protein [Mammaliicoccus vitulinus]|uniref:hypothetical protein n=1 Tax=Mammaliicoccus vitulinus TaxID=71237 RepID=UPI003F9646CB